MRVPGFLSVGWCVKVTCVSFFFFVWFSNAAKFSRFRGLHHPPTTVQRCQANGGAATAGENVSLPTCIRAVLGYGDANAVAQKLHTEVNSAADVVSIATTILSQIRAATMFTRKKTSMSTSGGNEMKGTVTSRRTHGDERSIKARQNCEGAGNTSDARSRTRRIFRIGQDHCGF